MRDVGLAEDLAQDALVAALEQWPESGVPRNPGAWLMAIAKRRAIDLLRRKERLGRKIDELGHELETGAVGAVPEIGAAPDEDIDDDLLRLVFTACHPVLSTEARVALTLRLLGGLTTEEIARAFLVSESTVAQRIVRAKRTLAATHVPFEVPQRAELAVRLSSVLEVVYLVFNEGYSATAGDDWMRPALCEEALRLGRILAELAAKEPEVHGLVALMEIQASPRARADRHHPRCHARPGCGLPGMAVTTSVAAAVPAFAARGLSAGELLPAVPALRLLVRRPPGMSRREGVPHPRCRPGQTAHPAGQRGSVVRGGRSGAGRPRRGGRHC